MNDFKLAEQLRYSNPKELFVVTWYDQLIKLTCPFKVTVISDIGVLVAGEIVLVDEVKVTTDLITVFLVRNQAYYYYHFNILIK